MIDTTSFNSCDNKNYKSNTQDNWGENPCGSNYISKDIKYLSKEYFDNLKKQKYSIEDWKLKEFDTFNIDGKKVLEIGYGMGSDHVMLARKGALLHGIDITPESKNITQAHLYTYNLKSELLTGDAEYLPYSDNFFDFVYSFGVLHYTPNIQKAIHEVYRVTKQGGYIYIALYNKNSIFFRLYILCDFIFHKQYKTMTLQERLSLIEYPNTNKNLVVKLHTKHQLKKMFREFNIEKIYTKHLTNNEIPFGISLPRRILNFLGNFWGWYIIIRGTKPL